MQTVGEMLIKHNVSFNHMSEKMMSPDFELTWISTTWNNIYIKSRIIMRYIRYICLLANIRKKYKIKLYYIIIFNYSDIYPVIFTDISALCWPLLGNLEMNAICKQNVLVPLQTTCTVYVRTCSQ